MDVYEAIEERQSVRFLTDKKVPLSLLNKIFDSVKYAPSAHNAQPWSFVVVTKKLDEIWNIIEKETSRFSLKGAWKKVRNAPVLIAACMKSPDKKQIEEDRLEEKMFFESMGAVIQNLLLLLHAEKLGACWLGGTTKRAEGKLKEYLEIPQNHGLVSLISVGYPDENRKAPKKPRKDLKEFLFYEKFNSEELLL